MYDYSLLYSGFTSKYRLSLIDVSIWSDGTAGFTWAVWVPANILLIENDFIS